ncbi:MAG: SIR2 family protein [Candidatus Hydrogenedentes bacterium]|nr:SIR2 family protein [Candidatus Hydrogenedentota bacterium]
MRIGFVCGAGTSIPVGMSSTSGLTETILAGRDFNRHTSGVYCFDNRKIETHELPEKDVPRIATLLAVLKNEIDQYYHCGKHDLEDSSGFYEMFGRHETNYEDLYYCARQLSDSDHFEYENPTVMALFKKLNSMSTVKAILRREPWEIHENWRLTTLLSETCNYIRDVVAHELCRTLDQVPVVSPLITAACDDEISLMDVYTLNHDMVIEQLLASSGVPHCDGFTDLRGDVMHWNPDSLPNSNARVRLFKLHGSVNWFSFSPSIPMWGSQCTGIALNGDIYHAKNERGERHPLEVVKGPLMLMGTFNKIIEYNYGIFADLQLMFHQNLRETDSLVVCGYSFGDKAVNTRLLDWLHSSGLRRMAVIDPSADSMNRIARGAVRRQWDCLVATGKIIPFNLGIESADWHTVKHALSGKPAPDVR